VWSPLASGFLSGKYTRDNLNDPNNRLSGFDFLPHDKESGFKILDTVRDIAHAHGATPAQVSLAWLLAQSHVSSILVGTSKVAQLEDNLNASKLQYIRRNRTSGAIYAPCTVVSGLVYTTTLDSRVAEALK
jgi:aryl-alcohol dehydrogenase-like predicted oxidoreductase